jgi:hypothetical protein
MMEYLIDTHVCDSELMTVMVQLLVFQCLFPIQAYADFLPTFPAALLPIALSKK